MALAKNWKLKSNLKFALHAIRIVLHSRLPSRWETARASITARAELFRFLLFFVYFFSFPHFEIIIRISNWMRRENGLTFFASKQPQTNHKTIILYFVFFLCTNRQTNKPTVGYGYAAPAKYKNKYLRAYTEYDLIEAVAMATVSRLGAAYMQQ